MGLLNMFSRGYDAMPADAIAHDDMVEAVASGNCTIIDVREAGEFANGRIEGSINIPLSSFNPARAPKDKPIIVHCLTGARSAMAMNILRSAGYTDVRNYRPGIAGWRMQGGRLL